MRDFTRINNVPCHIHFCFPRREAVGTVVLDAMMPSCTGTKENAVRASTTPSVGASVSVQSEVTLETRRYVLACIFLAFPSLASICVATVLLYFSV
jgi:hypothetical protein